ncbi:glutenin, low molecular weight subunit-like [Humulus lupulus]|uniref:glutenin, low molecular weight subunit-like n=1 Tax=Humulus lupulus TaxID=3486 RepID=UPI002B4153C6|nr:glutenin, low molecular weight subunit-like [Humulus lupulus]
MAKTSKKAGQVVGATSSQSPPPNVAENQPYFHFEQEEMDYETLRATLGVLQDELASLRANQENTAETLALQQREIERQRQELNERQTEMDRRHRDATTALEAAIHFTRGHAAPASQPDQPPRASPQRAPNPSPPIQPTSPQRSEQPPVSQDDVPIRDPEQQPPSQRNSDVTEDHYVSSKNGRTWT